MTIRSLFTSLSVLLLSISASAEPIPAANIGGFDMIYRGEYFTSEKNLSDKGSDTDDLPFGGEYTNFSNLIEIGYSMRPAFRVSLGTTLAYASSDNDGIATESRTNSEFNNVALSAQYFIGTDKFRFVPNLRANIALNEVELTTDEVMSWSQVKLKSNRRGCVCLL